MSIIPQERAAIHRPATRSFECAAYAKQPERRTKFLCNEMLKRLGHWLRVAGYDALKLPDGTSGRELIQSATEEHRVLVTRDREMACLANHSLALTTLDCIDLQDKVINSIV